MAAVQPESQANRVMHWGYRAQRGRALTQPAETRRADIPHSERHRYLADTIHVSLVLLH